MVKPFINEKLRKNEIEKIKDSLLKSDKIVIYGSSLGETDKIWWEYIGDWIKRLNEKSIR